MAERKESEKGTFYFRSDHTGRIRRTRVMPLTARASAGELCYHVINLDNARTKIFREPEDYAALLMLLLGA